VPIYASIYKKSTVLEDSECVQVLDEEDQGLIGSPVRPSSGLN